MRALVIQADLIPAGTDGSAAKVLHVQVFENGNCLCAVELSQKNPRNLLVETATARESLAHAKAAVLSALAEIEAEL